MPRKTTGRPGKGEPQADNHKKIIDATIALIKKSGADSVTVRNVCEKADVSIGTFYHYFRDKDDLMIYFLREIPFSSCSLKTSPEHVGDRISELYMLLINRYQELGLDFMKSFYSTSNRSLSAYMGEQDGSFAEGTVMARSEEEMKAALESGYIKSGTDIHQVCMDICTIVKGCVFEWCLSDNSSDIRSCVYRIINNYLSEYISTADSSAR